MCCASKLNSKCREDNTSTQLRTCARVFWPVPVMFVRWGRRSFVRVGVFSRSPSVWVGLGHSGRLAQQGRGEHHPHLAGAVGGRLRRAAPPGQAGLRRVISGAPLASSLPGLSTRSPGNAHIHSTQSGTSCGSSNRAREACREKEGDQRFYCIGSANSGALLPRRVWRAGSTGLEHRLIFQKTKKRGVSHEWGIGSRCGGRLGVIIVRASATRASV